MNNSMAVRVLFCIAILGVAGCNTSEPGPSDESGLAGKEVQSEDKEVAETSQAPMEEDLNTFLEGVEGKMDQLKVKHVKLVNRVQQAGLKTKPQTTFYATLDDLKKKREDVQIQIEALKTGKKKDWTALQLGMNLALESLAHSYDTALAQFAG